MENVGKSRLIVIDGLDGSGKSTQTELVYEYLKKKDNRVLLISYPDYQSKSSALVKMYLSGEFSADPQGVNAYAASSFYAVDRYASFKQHWESYYNAGYTIIATRYVSSNAIHQMSKLEKSEWNSFLEWLSDYEFGKLCLPRPDATIFLDMPRHVANTLLTSRYHGDESMRDIHEKNIIYMQKCEEAAYFAAKEQKWYIVPCADEGKPCPKSLVTKRILNIIEKIK